MRIHPLAPRYQAGAWCASLPGSCLVTNASLEALPPAPKEAAAPKTAFPGGTWERVMKAPRYQAGAWCASLPRYQAGAW